MNDYIRKYVQTCVDCQRNKVERLPPAGLLQPNPVPTTPWSHITMDFIVDLPRTPSGHNAIITFVDRLTKMVHFYPCTTNITALQTAQAFLQSVYRLHGLPSVIFSDRDPKFLSNFWSSLFKILGTKLNLSTARHPQTDGQSERANQTIEEMLRHYINPKLNDWVDHLPYLEFAYNNSVQASTAASPFYLNYGQHPSSILDVALPAPDHHSVAAHSLVSTIQAAIQSAIQRLQISQQRSAQYANRSRRDLSFSVGDLVLVSSDGLYPPGAHSMARKLQPRFYGPFPIIAVKSPVNYVLQLPDHMRVHNNFHVSRLRPFHSDSRHVPPPQPVLVDGCEEYYIQRILSHKPAHRPPAQATHFLVEWLGYPGAEHHTLLPRAELADTEALDVYLGHAPAPPPAVPTPSRSARHVPAQPLRRSARLQP
jgi:hypothetical protein